MTRPLLLSALLLTSCVTSPDPPPPATEMSRLATVCVIMFPGHKAAESRFDCTPENRTAIGFAVAPIDGDCEAGFFTLNQFQQIWDCQ